MDAMVNAYFEAHEAHGSQPRRDGIAAALRVMADEIDQGPTFPMSPSVISALIRERADRLEATDD